MLSGLPVAQAIRLLSTLFAICGTAQAAAGLAAVEAAEAIETAPAQRAARMLLVLAETGREHAFRMVVGWPEWFGGIALRPEAMIEAIRALGRIGRGLYPFGDWARPGGGRLAPDPGILEEAIDAFEHLAGEIGSWAEDAAVRVETAGLAGFGASAVALMPDLDAGELAAAMAKDPGFAARPSWQGRVFETGPLARMAGHPRVAATLARHGNGILARLVARIAEFSELAPRMRSLAEGLAPDPGAAPPARDGGSGAAALQAARGLLVHRVEVAEGRIAGYGILAPTEWNFHPDGPLVQGLVGLPAAEIDRRAAILATALDPCVAFDVVIPPRRS